MSVLDKLRNWLPGKQKPPETQDKFSGLTPDAIHGLPGSVSFFYVYRSPQTGKSELLTNGDQNATHWKMIVNPQYGPHIFPDDRWKNMPEGTKGISPRGQATQYALVGRLGTYEGQRLVILWNANATLLSMYLPPLLRKLRDRGFVSDDALVVTPVSRAKPLASYLGEFQATDKLSNSQQNALYSRLHTMPPDEKRVTMQKLGLSGGFENPWTTAMRSAGVLGPGQYAGRIGEDFSFQEWLKNHEG